MRNKLRLLGMSVFVPAALSAQQFIANGGFESGSLSSWAAYFAPGSNPVC